MVDLSISKKKLVVKVLGADKLWSFKSSLEIPLEHIVGVRSDPAISKARSHGWRLPGTSLPGVITAGTFYQEGQRVFWDVHNPDKAVVIELRNERYDHLVVEVADPEGAVEQIGRVRGIQTGVR